MSDPTRRQLLAGLLGVLAQAAGTVVLARSVLPEPQTEGDGAGAPPRPEGDLQERADRVAAEQGPLDEEEGTEFVSFVNGGFRNGGGGGFRKGGFANGGGGGGFRNGGFRNGGGGGFRNGGFANGGGGFRKGAFRNF
jgi:hypothetical protein